LAERRPAADQIGSIMDLRLDHYSKDGFEVVDVEGEIDVYTAPRLRELLIDLVNHGEYKLILNLGRVEFLDSTGMGVLVGGLKRVRAHDGSMYLVCTQERILKIFRITGNNMVLPIFDTVDEAVTTSPEVIADRLKELRRIWAARRNR
jgi:anti-sigma B factor antagonist